MEKFNFVRTIDSDTKKLLISQGFKIVSDDGTCATFINESNKLNFDSIDKSKLQYTNMLCI
ncbi:MAG: hypothetical protein KBT35_01565 [Firmicutes bacterium]|nr:hypothetical protein [Candidatus Colivicinus equi]